MRENKLIRRILLEILDCSKVIFFALAASMIIKNTVVASAMVPTGSMEETIMTGSRIVINRLAYVAEAPLPPSHLGSSHKAPPPQGGLLHDPSGGRGGTSYPRRVSR